METAGKSGKKSDESGGSSSDASSSVGVSNVTVSVNRETRHSVELLMRIRGLKPKSSIRRFLNNFSKHSNPDDYCANARFTKWTLNAVSLAFSVRVQTEKRRKRKKKNKSKHRAAAAAAAAAADGDDDGKKKKAIVTASPDDDSMEMHTEVFDFAIRQFPSEINAESTKFEILEPSGRNYCFLMLTMEKVGGTASVSWKEFQASNGTLDAFNCQ